MKKKGFTLIEVMAVLVILVIIASIAVPAYIGYSDKAQIKVCEANCSNLATAFETAYKLESLNDMHGEADSLANVVKGRVGQAESAGTDPVVQWLLDHEYIDHDMKCPKTGEEYYVLCEKGSVKIQCHYHKDLEAPVVNTGAWSSGAGSSGGFSDDDSYVYSTAAPVVTAAPDAGGEADKVDKIELLDDEGNLLSDETLTYYLSEAPDSVDGFRSRLKVKVYYKDGSSEVTTDYIIDGSYTKAIGTYSFQVRKNNATGQKADLTVKIVDGDSNAAGEIRNYAPTISKYIDKDSSLFYTWDEVVARISGNPYTQSGLPDRSVIEYKGKYYFCSPSMSLNGVQEAEDAVFENILAPYISNGAIHEIPYISYILQEKDTFTNEGQNWPIFWNEDAKAIISQREQENRGVSKISIPPTLLRYYNNKIYAGLYVTYDTTSGAWFFDNGMWIEIPTK